jgi:hypothetical protein
LATSVSVSKLGVSRLIDSSDVSETLEMAFLF